MTESSATPLLSLRGIGRRYAPKAPWALRNVDLDVFQGDFIAVTGPSGAGKSTLLNVMAMLDSYDTGSYVVDGHDLTQLSRRKRDALRGRTFGFVFQHSNAIENRSVVKNVEVPLVSAGTPFDERPSRIGIALTRANIRHKANQRVSLLSGGERQRMAIARALTTNPTVLFLDEPTGNLDSSNSESIMSLLAELNAAGTTIVLVTHDLVLAARARRQVTVIDGELSEKPQHDTAKGLRPSAGPNTPTPEARWWRRPIDAVCEAAWSLWDNRTRSAIEILTTAVAVGGLAASVSLGLTASNQVDRLIASAAQDTVTVSATADANKPESFSDDDLAAVTNLTGVIAAGRQDRVAASDANISRLGPEIPTDTPSVELVGLTSGSFKALDVSVPPTIPGLFESPQLNRSIAVVGTSAARSLHVDAGPGETVSIGDQTFDVLAIAAGTNLSNAVIVPHQAILSLHLPAKQLLTARTESGRAAVVSNAIPLAINPANPGGYTVTGAANLAHLRGDVSSSLQLLLLLLSGVLLIAAIIATSAIMSSAVLQRRAEIGLRMATGASPASVGSLFVMEGGVLGAVGSVVGLLLGIATVLLVSVSRGWTPYFDFPSLVVSLVVGIAAGIVSSILPSIRASRIQPAIAVRG